MAPYVFKIKYGEILRRVNVEPSLLGTGPDMSFRQLEDTIRQTFNIPVSSEIVITYTDKDNDVVTMAGDQDLQDACVLQGLNPLRLTVSHSAGDRHFRWTHQNRPQMQMFPDFKNFLGNQMKLAQETQKPGEQGQQAESQGVPRPLSDVIEALVNLVSPYRPAPAPTNSTETVQEVPKPAEKNHVPLQPLAPPYMSCSQPQYCGPIGSGSYFHAPPPFPPFIGHPGPYIQGPPHIRNLGPQLFKMDPAGSSKGGEQVNGVSMEAKEPVVHNRVQCDVCDMCPIVGTRYKSNKKVDYDLCQKCFQEFGSIEDYTPIERPLWQRPRHCHSSVSGGRMGRCPAAPSFYGGSWGGAHHGGKSAFNMRGPHMHGAHAPYGGKVVGGPFNGNGGKLDARFVQDVTIFDGTELAPGTSFSKIWRLRNSGTFAWPKSTQLVHVGGDELGSCLAVTVELSEEGLSPDGEVEVSVDLVAPERPGRYVSHWRLVSPTGQKFGHRVWVLIQVVPKDEQSPQMMESLISSQEDVALPEQEAVEEPMTTESQSLMEEDLVASDMEVVGKESQISSGADFDRESEKVQYPEISMEPIPAATVEDEKAQEDNPFVESSELGNFSMVDMPSTELPQLVEATIVPEVVEVENISSTNEKEAAGIAAEIDSVDVMLGTLESMGFKQRELNLEVLKKNEYDMQRTLDDLVMAAEWDPMLEELEEMGFYDTDMNRRLMFKNNGSVKRVVKELVQMYKDPKGKEQI